MPVNIFFKTPPPPAIKNAEALIKKAVRMALGAKFASRPVCLIFTGDRSIRELNGKFLGRNRVTDVIAFSYPAPPGFKAAPVFGDIYVCLPQARRQANNLKHTLLTELLILSVHGALHLAGMSDSSPALRRRMNLKTAAILKRTAVWKSPARPHAP